MNLIDYEDKEQLYENPSIPSKNKVMASDMNNIKNAINNLLLPAIRDVLLPIGIYIHTSDINFNPNETIGGTWELDNDGTVLVSKSTVSGSSFNANIGNTVGEEKHTLTIEEMPSHTHTLVYFGNNRPINLNAGGSSYHVNFDQTGSDAEQVGGRSTGGSQSHSIVQPSKIVYRWHRIA